MRYGFLNNFSQALAADLAAGATTMTLDGGGDRLADASSSFIFTLTLFDDDGNVEIVHVTSGGTNSPTVSRGEEGTTDREWLAGTKVEARLTAAAAGGFAWGQPSSAIHSRAVSIQPERASADQVASGYASVAIGENSKADDYVAVALGTFSEASGTYAAALGPDSHALANDALAVGRAAFANFQYAIAIGRGVTVDQLYGVAIGPFSVADWGSEYGMALGPYAYTNADGAMSIGHGANSNAAGQVALGPKANPNTIQSAMDLTAIPVMRSSILSPQSYQHATAMRVTLPLMLRSDDVSLASTGDVDSLTLPTDTMLLVDRIEAVVISSAGSGSTPTINIGTTPGGNDVLDSHVMAGDTVLSREQLVASPLGAAVSALHFNVETAAAAAMEVRFVVHGYVMEV